MKIRTAKRSDASSIAAISIEVWIGTYLKRGVNEFFAKFALKEFTAENITAQISDPAAVIYVSESEEGIVGFIRVSFGNEPPVASCSDIEISTFYVQPRHHRKGIGKRLLKAAAQHCRDKGAKSFWLATNAQNSPGIAFYLGQGFQQVGETHFRIQEHAYLNNVYSYKL